jgi:hypothetical protein
MTEIDQLHYLLGYIEGLKTKSTVYPHDLAIVMNAIESNSLFHEASDKNEIYEDDGYDDDEYVDTDYDYNNESYGEYAGSYAQDVEGLSDDFINDVLDGDPDNYWNID